MAAPEMGNVGTNPIDDESARPHAVGMIVRSLSGAASNWRARGDARRLPRASRGGRAARHRHPQAGPPHPHPRRADGGHLQRGPLGRGAGGAGPPRSGHGGAGSRRRESAPGSPTSSPSRRPSVFAPERPPARSSGSTWSPTTTVSRRRCSSSWWTPGCRVTVVPGGHPGRGGAGETPARRLPDQRPRRPGGGGRRRPRGGGAPRQGAGVRHLPRAPDPRPGHRRHDLQDEVRPPGREPAGEGSPDRQGGDHRPEPRLRGGRGLG